MKKLYASIFATFLFSATMMAQEETTFQFVYNGEVIPNGSTVVVASVETTDLGALKMFEMKAPVKVKNVSEDNSKVTLVCEGVENFANVQFCPNGSCQGWGDGNELSTTYGEIPAESIVDETPWLHVSYGPTTESTLTYDGTIILRAFPPLDEDDCATITIHFDTNGTDGVMGLHTVSNDVKIEVFNLCGKKIANSTVGLSKGVYIVRQGNTSRKMTIR